MAIPMHYETSLAWSGADEQGDISFKALTLPTGSPGDADRLDPEHMLLGATEICLFNTFAAIAANSKLTIVNYSSSASGELSFTKGEGYRFESITVKPTVTIAEADLRKAERILEKSHSACLITRSLTCESTMVAEWVTQ